MAVSVVEVAVSAFSTGPPTVSLSTTPAAGDVVVLFCPSGTTATRTITAVSGLGATWAITDYSATMAASVAIGTGATTSGTITTTSSTTAQGTTRAYLIRGLGTGYSQGIQSTAQASSTGTLTGPSNSAAAGAIVLECMNSNKGGATTTWTRTGYTTDANGVATNSVNITAGSAYVIPGSSGTYGTTVATSTAAASRITQVILTPAAGSLTADVAATLPSLTASTAATSTVTAATAASLPSLTAASAATSTVTATGAASLPSLTAAVAASVSVPAGVGATLPSMTATVAANVNGVTSAAMAATLPSLTGAVAGVATVAAGVAATLPSLTAAVSVAGGAATTTAAIGATLPSLTVEVGGYGPETVTTCLVYTPDGLMDLVPLVPVEPLATAVPITRTSILAPVLSAAHPFHPEQGSPGAPEVIREVVGYPQLWVGGQNVTNLRGTPVLIRKWESEAPLGDTVAAFSLPQKNPWDKDGEGDLAFLRGDATVAIGMRETYDVGGGFTATRVRRLWSGFLDGRGNGLGADGSGGEYYDYEAKGTFRQAESQFREPVALTKPVDIGVQFARTMNAVEGRRWSTMPETPIGITTMTRGSRDQTYWDYAQALLSEAITDDLRQWTISEVAPGIPRLVLKPAPTTVHATVAYGTPGVECEFRVDESTRVDRIYMRGIGPKMGGWANMYYPGVELLQPPPYPMASLTDYIVLGTTDADTVSGTGVTDWQTRVSELRSFANPAVSGVMSAAWVAVIDDLQRRVGVTPDNSLGPQTWNATFDRALRGVDLTPVRLPMASKPEANKYLYSAAGVKLGVNPAYDPTLVVRDIAVDVGPGKTKADGFKLARKILGMYGTAAANGQIVWTTDPNETDRTRLSHLSNVKVLGFGGSDRVVQVASKSVELEAGEDGPAYVVTTSVDERARDAMAVEDLLAQRRSAQPDPSRRPGNPNKASRQVSDQRTPWDSESPCGVLRRTAVNGASGLWTVVTVPFAEVGQLSGIRLKSDRPFALALFASLRITENKLAAIVGNPFASDDPWRNDKGQLDEYGIIESWGAKGVACGYSPKTEGDPGAVFTGKFEIDTPVDYWTETVPYVSVAIFMRGGSGWISGQFIPAYET